MVPAGTAHAPTEDLLPRSRERRRTVPNARILPPAAATLLVLSAAAAAPDAGRAQVALGPALEARVYYRAARDAYVAIFHIDTDGTSRLVFPRSPDEDHYVRGAATIGSCFRSRLIGTWKISPASGTTSSSPPFNASTYSASDSLTMTTAGT